MHVNSNNLTPAPSNSQHSLFATIAMALIYDGVVCIHLQNSHPCIHLEPVTILMSGSLSSRNGKNMNWHGAIMTSRWRVGRPFEETVYHSGLCKFSQFFIFLDGVY